MAWIVSAGETPVDRKNRYNRKRQEDCFVPRNDDSSNTNQADNHAKSNHQHC